MRKETPAKTLASALAALATFVAPAATWTDGEGIEWTYTVLPDETVMLGDESGSGLAVKADTAGVLVIPEKIDGKTVSTIGKRAFYSRSNLEGVVFPSGLRSIKTEAFKYCDALKTLTFPDGVTEIGEGAFEECYDLWSVDLPKNLKVLEENVFGNCCRLQEVDLPERLEEIRDMAFSYSVIPKVHLPAAVTNVSCQAFFRGVYLSAFSVDPANAFYSVKDGMLLSKDGKTFLLVPAACENVFVPEGVTTIAPNAFCNCRELSSITLPESVEKLCDFCITENESIMHVVFLGEMPACGENAFSGNNSSLNVKVQKDRASWADVGETWLGLTVLEAAREGIDSTHGFGNILLTYNVKNGKAVVGSVRFGYTAIDPSVSGKIVFPAVLGGRVVTSIGNGALRYCENITEVVISSYVTNIGHSAFEGCSALRSVEFPQNLKMIGSHAFYNCPSLSSVRFTGEEPDVGEYAFYGCPSTCRVYAPDNWKVDGYDWQGLSFYRIVPTNAVYHVSLPLQTLFRLGSTVTIQPFSRSGDMPTQKDLENIASQVKFFPDDPAQDARYFKGVATVNADREAVVTAALDLEELEFSDTLKAFNEQILSQPAGDTAEVSLPNAKSGFWYGVTVSEDLSSLGTAPLADVIGRATAEGLTLKVSKPASGTAFFKVEVSSKKIPILTNRIFW